MAKQNDKESGLNKRWALASASAAALAPSGYDGAVSLGSTRQRYYDAIANHGKYADQAASLLREIAMANLINPGARRSPALVIDQLDSHMAYIKGEVALSSTTTFAREAIEIGDDFDETNFGDDLEIAEK